jgi:hypothetical protein
VEPRQGHCFGLNEPDFINWAAELELIYVELLSYYMNREDNLRAPNRHPLFVSESVSQIRQIIRNLKVETELPIVD